jgi:voltage-gated potassium channel
MDTSFKHRIFEIIDDTDENGFPNTIFDYFIISLIILNIFAIFIETYQSISLQYGGLLDAFELFSVIVFTIEYILRIWTCTYYTDFKSPLIWRLKYASHFMMLIDLFSFLPYYLAIFIPLDPRIIKLFRLFRLFRILKLLRYYSSTEVIYSVLRKNREYLYSIFFLIVIFLIFASYLIYILESEAQPDKFGNIDQSFWWAVISLTTVGYGDVYPSTGPGKFFTTFILLIGIGMIALPTGLIASGFLEEMKSRRECPLPLREISIADEIRKIAKLKDEGIITEEEFEKLKDKLLS